MVHIQSPQEAYLLHARKGDPSAFLALLGPHLGADYLSMCKKNIGEETARETIVHFALSLYSALYKTTFSMSNEQWYQRQRKSFFRLKKHRPGVVSPLCEIEESSVSRLNDSLNSALQKAYSALRKQEEKSTFFRLFLAFRQYPALKFLLGLCCIVAGFFGIHAVCVLNGVLVSTTITAPRNIITLSFPAGPYSFLHSTTPGDSILIAHSQHIQPDQPDSTADSLNFARVRDSVLAVVAKASVPVTRPTPRPVVVVPAPVVPAESSPVVMPAQEQVAPNTPAAESPADTGSKGTP